MRPTVTGAPLSRRTICAVAILFNALWFEPFAGVVTIGRMIDHALGEQSGERFGQIKMTGVTHGTHEESRIEQMQNGVLDAADILVNRQPVIDLCRANRRRRAG